VANCFQIAIAHLTKILKVFNPQYSSHLKSYGQLNIKQYTVSRRLTRACFQTHKTPHLLAWGYTIKALIFVVRD